MIMCLDQFVDPDVDLVFVEYIMNNGDDFNMYDNRVVKDMERLIRRLLALPGKPAVVLMQAPNMLHPGMEKQEPVRYPFHKSMEDLETSLSHFHDVQALSLRTALFRLAEVERREGFRWRDTFFDHHPGDSGNRMMADLAVFLAQETAMDLLLSPHRPEEAAELNGPLLEPMYEGDEPPASTMCAVGTSFQSMVTNATEFNFTDEGRGKWGFVATQPGVELVVRLDTRLRVIHGGGPAPSTAQVYFHHLRSHQHMGGGRGQLLVQLHVHPHGGRRAPRQVQCVAESPVLRGVFVKTMNELAAVVRDLMMAAAERHAALQRDFSALSEDYGEFKRVITQNYNVTGRAIASLRRELKADIAQTERFSELIVETAPKEERGRLLLREVSDEMADRLRTKTYLAPLLVSASADCRVAIRVLHDTSSREHKFKGGGRGRVSGLVVAEDAQAAGVLDRLTMDHGRMPEGVFEDRVAEKTSAATRLRQQGAGPPPPGPAAVGGRR
ncbi:hypothetical protein HYH03_014201 [Edaphochlamys debaryana]|uniref:SGNH hydrolase-type esterase domain-containing protein n=1 Tax=Edaphochlamys debaryana TaxID=47281 RepID=A0A836BTU3_9CHLO|nr:hypothetical protein HYH03_014201 [Edaphochlamys debaryana]|eukprot:KAG2487228.1 hypothetical protein HYH03_014201 [Edaphochlamys debaryana]